MIRIAKAGPVADVASFWVGLKGARLAVAAADAVSASVMALKAEFLCGVVPLDARRRIYRPDAISLLIFPYMVPKARFAQ